MVGSYLLGFLDVRSKLKWLFPSTEESRITDGLCKCQERLCMSPWAPSVFIRNNHLAEGNALHVWMKACLCLSMCTFWFAINKVSAQDSLHQWVWVLTLESGKFGFSSINGCSGPATQYWEAPISLEDAGRRSSTTLPGRQKEFRIW